MFIIAPIIIFLMASFIVPAIASGITSSILGKSAKLDFDDKFSIAIQYYFICGFVFAVATILEDTGSFLSEALIFIGMFLLWPIGLSFVFMDHDDGGAAMVWGGLGVAFAITQIICIFKVLKRARAGTENLE